MVVVDKRKLKKYRVILLGLLADEMMAHGALNKRHLAGTSPISCSICQRVCEYRQKINRLNHLIRVNNKQPQTQLTNLRRYYYFCIDNSGSSYLIRAYSPHNAVKIFQKYQTHYHCNRISGIISAQKTFRYLKEEVVDGEAISNYLKKYPDFVGIVARDN